MRPMIGLLAGALLPCLLPGAGPAVAAFDLHVRQGEALAKAHCARCHAIGRVGDSPFPQAPRFREIHRRYPVEDLGEALAEGIRTGHPAMPEFRFDPDQAQDLIAYLKSLER